TCSLNSALRPRFRRGSRLLLNQRRRFGPLTRRDKPASSLQREGPRACFPLYEMNGQTTRGEGAMSTKTSKEDDAVTIKGGENIELTDDQLGPVSGGMFSQEFTDTLMLTLLLSTL